VYLGYAAGVGKTYRMLQDAQTLHRQGADIVLGYLEPHGRRDTIAKAEGLPLIPRRIISYGRTRFEEMDAEAIIKRKPAIAVVDELAHTNVPGAGRQKRWHDVRAILNAGIDVLTTMNVQHLESLNDHVRRATGVRVRETIPDWVLDEADCVIFVDLTPRALRNRLKRGVVYGTAKAKQAMENFFTEANLSALRELAMRHAAHEVEEHLSAPPPRRRERILVCLTGAPESAILIRRGRRVADYLQAACLALHVFLPSKTYSAVPRRYLSFARSLRIEAHSVEARDIATAIVEFARAQGITQIFLGHPRPRRAWERLRESVVERVIRLARDRQITIVSERRGQAS
jgi:two-component system sensor histidine kinase KdpD